jgi:hypothetical protein
MDATAKTMQDRMLKLLAFTQSTSALIATDLCAASETLECVTERCKKRSRFEKNVTAFCCLSLFATTRF